MKTLRSCVPTRGNDMINVSSDIKQLQQQINELESMLERHESGLDNGLARVRIRNASACLSEASKALHLAEVYLEPLGGK